MFSERTLYIVATPIGNRDDLSARAIELLQQVDRIYAEDTRHSLPLLRHHGIDTRTWALHEHNEESQIDMVIEHLNTGASAALITDAGTPLISDPGYHLVQHLRNEGVKVVPIPGASAIIAALSIAGLATDRFVFEGFLPAKSVGRKQMYQRATQQTCTQVYYESSHRVVASIRDLIEIIEPDRQVVLCRELTKLFEQSFSGTATELLEWLESDSNHQKSAENSRQTSNLFKDATKPAVSVCSE